MNISRILAQGGSICCALRRSELLGDSICRVLRGSEVLGGSICCVLRGSEALGGSICRVLRESEALGGAQVLTKLSGAVSPGWSAKERPSRAWGRGRGEKLDFVVFYEGPRLWEARFVRVLRVREVPGGVDIPPTW